jgi:hypothetical protein
VGRAAATARRMSAAAARRRDEAGIRAPEKWRAPKMHRMAAGASDGASTGRNVRLYFLPG